MAKYLKFYLYLPLFFLYLFLLFSFYPQLQIVKIIFFLVPVSSVLSIFFLIKDNLKAKWSFLIQFPLLTLNSFLFLFLLNNPFWRYLFLIFFLIISGLFLFYLYRKEYFPRLYGPGSLEKIEGLTEAAIIFSTLVNLEFLNLFYNFNLIFVLAAVFLLFFWLFYYSSGSSNLLWPLIFMEFYLCLSCLPTRVFINSLIFLIFFYIIDFLWLGKQKSLKQRI